MEKIEVKVTKTNISLTNGYILNQGEYQVDKCKFTFSEEYADLVKKAVFVKGNDSIDMVIINDECDIPYEMLQNNSEFVLKVYGYQVDGDELVMRYSPTALKIFLREGSYQGSNEVITPSQFEQYEQALHDGLEEVNSKLGDIDQALEDVNTAINETNNLDLDVSKSGKIATVELTKKNGTTKTITLNDGASLMFNWNGTELGIKTDEDVDYTYVDLQGVQGETGPMGAPFTIKKTYATIQLMIADYDNMNVGDYVMIDGSVETQENATLWVKEETESPTYKWHYLADFSGATGIQGETGLTPNIQIGTVVSGSTPSVVRTGTNENPILNFVLEKGETGATGATGATGNGIASIVLVSETASQKNFRINYTDGTYFDYSLENGEVTQADFDRLQDQVADLSDNQLIAEEEGTEVYVSDGARARLNEFRMTKESSQETTTGKNLLNNTYGNKTETGITFTKNSDGTITANGTSTAVTYYNISKQTLPAGSYILSGCPAGGSSDTYGIFANYGSYFIDRGTGVDITLNQETTPTEFYIEIRNGVTLNNVVFKPMIRLASVSDATYEPYTNGPSPNPNYPQEVNVVEGYRNLFNKDKTVDNFYYNNNGTTTEDGTNKFINQELSLSNNYVISFKSKQGNAYVRFVEYDASDNFIKRTLYDTNNQVVSLSENTKKVIVSIDAGPVSYFENLMIVEGNQALPYAPYGNNYVNVEVASKNLLNWNNCIENKAYNNDGELVNNAVCWACSARQPIHSNSITLSIDFPFTEGTQGRLMCFNENDVQTETYSITSFPLTINFNQNSKYYVYYFVNSIVPFNSKLQIENGSSATSYEPHVSNNAQIPLNGNYVAGIGNYKDEIIVDKFGKCYLNKKTGKVVLDGSEDVTSNPYGTNSYYVPANNMLYISNVKTILTNYFRGISYNDRASSGDNVCYSENGNIFTIRNTIFESIDDFKAWLSSHNTDVYYVLDEENLIDLNYTIDLKTFKGVSNITNSEEAYMQIKYVQDINTVISNITNSILEIGGGN